MMRPVLAIFCGQAEMRELQKDIANLQSLLTEHSDCFRPSSTVQTNHAVNRSVLINDEVQPLSEMVIERVDCDSLCLLLPVHHVSL